MLDVYVNVKHMAPLLVNPACVNGICPLTPRPSAPTLHRVSIRNPSHVPLTPGHC